MCILQMSPSRFHHHMHNYLGCNVPVDRVMYPFKDEHCYSYQLATLAILRDTHCKSRLQKSFNEATESNVARF